MDTRTWRGERLLAGVVVVALHVVLAWCAMRIARIPSRATTDRALQVVYLPPSVRVARPSRSVDPRLRRPPPRTTGMQARVVEKHPSDPPPASLADLSPAGIRRQLDALPNGDGDGDGAGAIASPLRNRDAALPGRAGGRFRMRRTLAPADVVAGIGRLFYGGGEADPCPRNLRNIASLQDGHDPAALQQELAFERKHCRP